MCGVEWRGQPSAVGVGSEWARGSGRSSRLCGTARRERLVSSSGGAVIPLYANYTVPCERCWMTDGVRNRERRRMTAAEIIAKNTKDPQFVARQQAEDARRGSEMGELRAAQAPLLAAL